MQPMTVIGQLIGTAHHGARLDEQKIDLSPFLVNRPLTLSWNNELSNFLELGASMPCIIKFFECRLLSRVQKL